MAKTAVEAEAEAVAEVVDAAEGDAAAEAGITSTSGRTLKVLKGTTGPKIPINPITSIRDIVSPGPQEGTEAEAAATLDANEANS